MREIKFRAWVPEVNMMIPWQYLNLELEDGYGGVKDNSIYDVLKDVENQVTSNFELMQYTGLKDKNGKEIYEGDVIIGEAEIPCRVIWDMKNGCFRGSAIKMSHVTIPAEAFTRREIIGNIYENADLLAEVNP